MFRTPKVFLVRRDAAKTEIVKRALTLTPVAGAIAASPDDALAASEVSDTILGLKGAPLAIVANFAAPLTVVFDDGSVETLIEEEPSGEHNHDSNGS